MEIGRSLATATDGTTNISYAYDADGLRTSKTVNSTTTYFFYAGGQLLRQAKSGNPTDFFYDANGYPYAMKRNGATYYYITNLQGDVMKLVDADGNVVANYEYDPYGKVISASGTMAHANPLRYRGYYYDSELEMYYLQSRYYDPNTGRFINADTQFDENAGVLGYNLFAYCANNPIMFTDVTGEAISLWLCIGICALVGAIAGWGYAKYFNIPKKDTWKYVLGGALIGGFIGGCAGYALSAGSGAVLWSGKGMGQAAAAFAKRNGLKVLEQTLRGRLLTVLAKVLPYKVMRPLWEAASARFLMSYAGRQSFVHVFITADAYSNMKSVFNSVEMQVVAELGLKIVWHFVK